MGSKITFRDYIFLGSRQLNLNPDSYEFLAGLLTRIHADSFGVREFREEFGLETASISDIYSFLTNGSSFSIIQQFGDRCYNNVQQAKSAERMMS